MMVMRDWMVSLNSGEKSWVLPRESRMRIWITMERMGLEAETTSGRDADDTSVPSSLNR